jgi:hypothetical protein
MSTVTNLDDIESFLQFHHEARTRKKYLTVIDLPKVESRIIMRDLALMGITAASMVPGLDSACEELRERNFP